MLSGPFPSSEIDPFGRYVHFAVGETGRPRVTEADGRLLTTTVRKGNDATTTTRDMSMTRQLAAIAMVAVVVLASGCGGFETDGPVDGDGEADDDGSDEDGGTTAAAA